MGYERITTIFEGIAIPEEVNLRDVLDDFIEKTSIKVEAFDHCTSYHSISFHELDGDWLYEYLSDMGYIIYDEYMSHFFLGKSLMSIDDDTHSCSLIMDNLPNFPAYNSEIDELIKLLFPDYKPHRYIINWYL